MRTKLETIRPAPSPVPQVRWALRITLFYLLVTCSSSPGDLRDNGVFADQRGRRLPAPTALQGWLRRHDGTGEGEARRASADL